MGRLDSRAATVAVTLGCCKPDKAQEILALDEASLWIALGAIPDSQRDRFRRFLEEDAKGAGPKLHTVPDSAYRKLPEGGKSLGQGGMGKVVLLESAATGRPVAVKIILSNDPEAEKLFIREASLAGRLQHANIPPLYELARFESGEVFAASRPVEGKNLKELWVGQGLAERMQTAASLAQVAKALDYAHRSKVIHRDVKPSNVVRTDSGEVYLIDWGLAVEVGEPVGTTPRGTSGYLSPAQERCEPATPQDDLHSLGVTLWSLLSGRTPGEAQPPRAVRWEDLPAWRDPEARLPREVASRARELASIAQKAMAASPSARYPSAAALASDLDDWFARRPVAPHRYSVPEKTRRWARKRAPALTIGVGAMTVLAALFAVLAGVQVQQNKTENELRQVADGQRDQAAGQSVIAEAKELEARTSEIVALQALGAQHRLGALFLERIYPGLARLNGSTPVLSVIAGDFNDFFESTVDPGKDGPDEIRHLAMSSDYLGQTNERVGKSDQARRAYARCAELYELVLAQGGTSNDEASEGRCLVGVGDALANEGHLAAGFAQVQKAIETFDAWRKIHPRSPELVIGVTFAESRAADISLNEGAPNQARLLMRPGNLDLAGLEAAGGSHELMASIHKRQAVNQMFEGDAWESGNDPGDAIDCYEKALKLDEARLPKNLVDARVATDVSEDLNRRGRALLLEGHAAAAAADFQRSLELMSGVVEPDRNRIEWLYYQANGLDGLGLALSGDGSNGAEAQKDFKAELAIGTRMAGLNPRDVRAMTVTARSLLRLGRDDQYVHALDALVTQAPEAWPAQVDRLEWAAVSGDAAFIAQHAPAVMSSQVSDWNKQRAKNALKLSAQEVAVRLAARDALRLRPTLLTAGP